jgi:ribosomal subunit interface protein
MKHTIEFKHWEPSPHLRDLVEASIATLDKLLAKFRPDVLFMRVLLERNEPRTLYRVSLSLDVPGRTLHAQEERHDVVEALREAFAEIEREIKRYKAKSSHSYEYKRPVRRRALQTK